EIQSRIDAVEAAARALRGGPAAPGGRYAVDSPALGRPRIQLAAAVVVVPAAAAAAQAALLAPLAVVAILVIIQAPPTIGPAVEDLLRKIQVLMAKLLDAVREAIEGIEDKIRKNTRAGMLCTDALIRFRTLSKQVLDSLVAPRPADELGQARQRKQLMELFQK